MTHHDACAGAQKLFREYLRPQVDDWCVVVYTSETKYAAALCVAAAKELGVPCSITPMLPLVDPDLRNRLAAALPAHDAFKGRLVIVTLEKETMSHFDVFESIIQRYGAARVLTIRAISAVPELFSEALHALPEELERLNATLLGFLAGEERIHVSSAAGTDLHIGLDQSRFDWISNRGRVRPGRFAILPAGEIATHADRVDGVLVADGALNANVLADRDMRLAGSPLRVEIADSQARSFSTEDAGLQEFVTRCFELPNGRRTGELGFGTNRHVSSWVPANSHLNERRPGLHIGFGQHNQRRAVGLYQADIHLDVVTDGAVITRGSDGATLDVARFAAATGVRHPRLVRDQDVTGDCCSDGCRPLSISVPSALPDLPKALGAVDLSATTTDPGLG